jgi:hypothetical protein
MYVKAQSKQRYGESKDSFINLDQIATIEIGHDGNILVKMSNEEEMVVAGQRAKLLLAWVEENQLS